MTNDKTVTMSRELADRVCAQLAETGQFLLSEEVHAVIAEPAANYGNEVERLNGMLDASSELLRTKQRANRELRTELERIKIINDNNFKLVLDRLFDVPAAKFNGEQMACMPVERCYDVRAKMIIAFNEARKTGGDLDDGLDAAYKAALRYSPNPLLASPPAPVAVGLTMADVMRANESVIGMSMLTSNQSHALAQALTKVYADKLKELNQ